jgi:hypothetical protein
MRNALPAGALVAAVVVVVVGVGPSRDREQGEARAERGSNRGFTIDIDRRAGTTVTARSRRAAIVRRGGAATVTCGVPGDMPSVELNSDTVPWERGATSIRLRGLKRGYDFCSVQTRPTGSRSIGPAADVAFNAAGRAMLVEREAAAWVFANLQKVQTVNRELRNGRYPTADELRRVNYLPLSTPDELPPPDAIGVYSSEAERRLRVVKLSASGAPVYVELVHKEHRTNVPHWMAWYFGR